MMKKQELLDPNSCMNRALDDELTFVLLERDPAAPIAIRAWAQERIRLGENCAGDLQIKEALMAADSMDAGRPFCQSAVAVARLLPTRAQKIYGSTDVAEGPAISVSPYPFETDPLGFNQHEPGAKLDAGKNRLGLIFDGFAHALEHVGRVGTYGANKYTDNGWKQVPNGLARYTDAMYRHLLAEQDNVADEGTGILHAAHAAWNALARLELMLTSGCGLSPVPTPQEEGPQRPLELPIRTNDPHSSSSP